MDRLHLNCSWDRYLRPTVRVLPRVLDQTPIDISRIVEKEAELRHRYKVNYDIRHRIVEKRLPKEGDEVFVTCGMKQK